MIDATVLFLTFTDQQRWGFSGKMGIDLNCSTDLDDNWYGPMCQVFKSVLRYDIFRGANIGGVCAANREIIEIAEAYHPKYVIYPCNFSAIVTEATLTTLRRIGCVVVGYFFDDDTYFEILSRWMIPYIDYSVSGGNTRGGMVAAYERLGARCILGVPFPMNPAIFRKLEGVEKLYDATFVGGLHANRREYLADIASHGVDVRYLGGGHGNKMHYTRMVKIYNQSRINLNFTSGQILGTAARHLTGRIFEITMCGGFLLTEYAIGLEDYFEIGREIACFETAVEAAEKIRYYLQRPDEREKIASCGHMRALRDYTGPKMLHEVFLAIETDLCKRGRPKPGAPAVSVNALRRTDAQQYYHWTQALLKSPRPLRDAWRETADLVLATNPAHEGAKRLLQRSERWGDPNPVLFRFSDAVYGLASSRLLSLGRRVKGIPRKRRAIVKLLRLFLTPVSKLRKQLFAFKIERFRRKYLRQPAPLELCIQLRNRASVILRKAEPLMPVASQLVSTGACLHDSELAEILREVELGSWSIASDTIEWLVDFLRRERPRIVLEFGSGSSTVCLCVLLQRIHGANGFRLLSLEQDSAEAERTRNCLSTLNGAISCRIVQVPLVPFAVTGRATSSYDIDSISGQHFAWLGKAEFVFIDGPSAEGPSRYEILTRVRPHLVSNAKFAMDDAFREEELLAGSLWELEGIVVEGILTHGKGLMVGKVP